MTRLVDVLLKSEEFRKFLREIRAGEAAVVSPSFVHAYVSAALLSAPPWRERPVLVVTPSSETAEELVREVSLFLPGRNVYHLPPRGVWWGGEAPVPPRVAGRRAQALAAFNAESPVVVAAASTLLEATAVDSRPAVALTVGTAYPFEKLVANLVDLGYERVDQVEEPGEISVRGGLIDVFPSTETHPVRAEFWGDEIESLRSFSVYSQRSLAERERVEVPPADEPESARTAPVLEFLAEDGLVLEVEPEQIRPAVEAFRADLADVFGDRIDEQRYLSWGRVERDLRSRPLSFVSRRAPEGGDLPVFNLRATSGELAATSLPEAERELNRLASEGYLAAVAFEQRAEAERAGYILKRVTGRVASAAEAGGAAGVVFLAAGHRRHFLIPDLRLALLTEGQIFPRRRRAAAERRLVVGAELSSFRDLRKGDFVVHEDHGIGRFEGISTKTVAGVTRDYLDVAFKGGDMLYIPHDQIEKVSRYVGAGGAEPGLSKLGGKAWEQVKSRARRAAREIAGELLQLYAARRTIGGHAFSEDGEWQRRFERSFPYQETEDQLRAIDQVKDDMESPHPMDRLICGDVGYGKTEVALRAAFKAVMDGKQVMVLVPTTILAQQHYGTFRERFAEFPVKVEMVSRFRSAREQKRVLEEFGKGQVDVLVGTHRILSQDVKPKDLGLVILDEEQRFGVAQKEALRQLKLRVDVLTLSATPIPRTLQMSLSGVRDISVIETPPQDRHPVQTYVGLYDEGMVKRAIEREVGRGGQVFYLHNRVETIDKAALRLSELLPALRIGVAHGQMPEQQLEAVMLDFLRGDYDVLVTTTIIESGLDIPNANTLVVERADLLGLSQLYQIRGRIGRSRRVAHAFLFHPDEAVLTPEATARLSTLADYTELGSGFKIAMRDLEIRGAGNLLGDEQSGHIAAVGFEMYLSMLNEMVESLQGKEVEEERIPRVDVPLSAYIPADFIGYEAARVDLHRRIAAARTQKEITALREELEDRFGTIPEAVDNLLFLAEVRTALVLLEADSLSVRQSRLAVTGLYLPGGSREVLRNLDRRYVYAPATGALSLSFKGDRGKEREVVDKVLADILPLRTQEVSGAA
ncbi:MAG: transcription-repair coupling factor [Thermoleophilia bacterium]